MKTAYLALLGLTVAACSFGASTTTTSPDELPGQPGVFASGLYQIQSCDELLDYYIEHAVDLVGPYGLPGAGGFFGFPEAVAADGDDAGAAEATRSHTGTNVQVAGVDEADLSKTDGDRIFVLNDGLLRVATLTADGVDIRGSLELNGWPHSMLLYDDTVVVIGGGGGVHPLGVASDAISPYPVHSATVQISQIDVSDPDTPTLVKTLQLDGAYVDARLVDSVARIAITSGPVGFDWKQPEGSGLRAEREAAEANRELVRQSTLENWLPYYILTDHQTGRQSEGQLLDCERVMAPATFAGISTLSLLTFDLDRGVDRWLDAGVVATGSTMYATASHTYISTQPWMDWLALPQSETLEAADRLRTQIHLFDTSGTSGPRYLASGEVKGFLLNQFAMDEFRGVLRVASTTSPDGWGWSTDSESRITILARSGNRLAERGVVTGLGEGERIFSVRFMGDVGYVVTFRQVDPLYTIDLSDPANPTVTGELKILGYSAYLHPVGEGLLLGLGQDADEDGRITGTQLSLFDVSDPAAPVRLDQVSLDGGWSQAEGDHHAFTFTDGLALAPYERWEWIEGGGEEEGTERFDTGVIAVRVSGTALSLEGILRPVHDEPLESKELWRVDPWRTVPLRTYVIDGRIYTITHGGIAIHDGDSLERIAFAEY